MSLVKRNLKSSLPTENPVNRKAIESAKSVSVLDKWREAHTSSNAGSRPRRKKVLGDIAYADVEEAIFASSGMISKVADALKIPVFSVKSIFKRYKLLEAEFVEHRERMLDLAEGILFQKVLEGQRDALLFYLKTQGKERGYIERNDFVRGGAKRGVKMKIIKAKDSNVLPFKEVSNE